MMGKSVGMHADVNLTSKRILAQKDFAMASGVDVEGFCCLKIQLTKSIRRPIVWVSHQ